MGIFGFLKKKGENSGHNMNSESIIKKVKISDFQVGEKVIVTFYQLYNDYSNKIVIKPGNTGTVTGIDDSYDLVNVAINGLTTCGLSPLCIQSLNEDSSSVFKNLRDWVPCRKTKSGAFYFIEIGYDLYGKALLKNSQEIEGFFNSSCSSLDKEIDRYIVESFRLDDKKIDSIKNISKLYMKLILAPDTPFTEFPNNNDGLVLYKYLKDIRGY